MMFMVLLVLDDPGYLDEVLEAWDGLGVSGATILESTGKNRRRLARQARASYLNGLGRMIGGGEEGHVTVLVIVPDEKFVQGCTEAVERIVGCLDEPHTGVLAAWPLGYVRGVPERERTRLRPLAQTDD